MVSDEVKKMRVDLLGIRKEYSGDFHRTVEATRASALLGLKPNAPAPPEGKIIGDAERQAFEERAAKYRSKGYDVIDSTRAAIRAQMGKAPSADAVNAVSMLSHRTDLTKEDVDALVDAYGSNYLTYEAIRDVAAQHEIFLDHHVYANDLKETYAAGNELANMDLKGAEEGTAASSSYMAFIEYAKDNPKIFRQ